MHGPYIISYHTQVLDRALFHTDNCYFSPNVSVQGTCCRTNLPSNTAFRGFGGPQGMFFAEVYMEHLASALRMPAAALRRENFYTDGQTTHYGQVLDQGSNIQRCWDSVDSMAENLEERRKAVTEFNANSRWRKRGLATIPTKFGISFTATFMNQAGALVHVYQDGSVLLSHGGVEMGQGLHTKMTQVCATALGVPVERIHISGTDTDKVPNTMPTAASASSDLNGMAVLRACETIQARLAPLREELGADATWDALVKAAYFGRVSLSSTGFYATPDIGWDPAKLAAGIPQMPFNYMSYGAACSEVEVDCLTGDFTTLRTDLVMDVGKAINPTIDVGQVEGGFVQGLGLFTLEEVVWGDAQHPWVRPGSMFTQGPSTYKIPGFKDIPIDFRVGLLENAENPRAVHSSKAVGEPPLFLGSSVFFALRDAIGAARGEADSRCEDKEAFFALDSPARPNRV